MGDDKEAGADSGFRTSMRNMGAPLTEIRTTENQCGEESELRLERDTVWGDYAESQSTGMPLRHCRLGSTPPQY